jgi:hypothetical protein
MVVQILILRFLKYLIFSIFIFLLATKVKAESKKDTLVNVAWRDTFKVRKAQIFEAEAADMMYYRPKPFQFAKNVPSDIYQLGKAAFSKKNLPKLGVILAGSALLVLVDQPVTDAAMQFGRYINLDPTRASKTLIEFNIGGFHVNAMEIPDNTNSAIYYLGEGWASMLVAGGLYSYGLAANDYRALQTTSQIAEGIFALGLTTQFLKRITGRQSPFRAMESANPVPAGDWHPFPNPGKYQKSVSNYDAFPSGHLATAMATVTILASNYPDNKYIKPVGYSLMGLLGYAMLNNGVHWISDYPLAIAIGYTCGKIVVSRGHQLIPKIGNDNGASSVVMPAYLGPGSLGLSYQATF